MLLILVVADCDFAEHDEKEGDDDFGFSTSLHFSLFLSYSNFSTVFGHQIGNMKKQVAKERWDAT
jgi:hypothetical protein